MTLTGVAAPHCSQHKQQAGQVEPDMRHNRHAQTSGEERRNANNKAKDKESRVLDWAEMDDSKQGRNANDDDYVIKASEQ